MQIELAYNSQKVRFSLPDSCTVDTFAPKSSDRSLSYEDFVKVLDKADLKSFFSHDSILFIVNDAHRSTPTAMLLQWFKSYNPELFSKIDFLVACGTHSAPDETQFRKIFGELYPELQSRISVHDCHQIESMQKIGKDSFGRYFYLNKKIFEYQAVFIINSVEPHYFAGYTGGRKSLVPGLADFKTIERNHNLANSLACMPLKLKGNPMAEHLEELLSLLELSHVTTLQVVYDSHNKIKKLCVGPIREAFSEAVVFASGIYACSPDKKYEVVFMEILPPLDKSIYQVQKALENCQAAVKDNGTAVIVAACLDGKGSEHFFELAKNWDKDKNEPKDGKLHFGSHKLSRVNAIGKRIDIRIFSEQPQELVSQVYYNAIDKTDKDLYAKLTGENSHVAVVRDAAHTVMIYE